MAKVKHVKARKDYPAVGISKGEMYYTWSLKTGPRSSRTFRQKMHPRRSQLTSSEFLSALYDWEDSLSACTEMANIETLAEEIESLGDEQRSKLENMPEGLRSGETGQLLETRADACTTAAESLREIHQEWQDAESDDADDEDHDEQDFLDRCKEVSVEL